jgi:NAD/NADP transhydrogenase alpha subunit
MSKTGARRCGEQRRATTASSSSSSQALGASVKAKEQGGGEASLDEPATRDAGAALIASIQLLQALWNGE